MDTTTIRAGLAAFAFAFGTTVACTVVACTVAEHPDADDCSESSPCPRGQTCYRGFCVAGDGGLPGDGGEVDGGPVDGGPVDGGVDAGEPCTGDETEPCYDFAGTPGMGRCQEGERACVGGVWSQCIGDRGPQPEQCNGMDDDCDGTPDNLGASCMTAFMDRCAEGTLVCGEDGSTSCTPVIEPMDEIVCNGVNEDCDLFVDEAGPCYTGSLDSCPVGMDCLGECRRGTYGCDGNTQICLGEVTPRGDDGGDPEDCDGRDNDCDGNVDEACSCTDADTQECYSGPAATREITPCMAGTQTCSGGRWGTCVGERLPRTETCDNSGADDDCNGMQDDILGLGDACTVAADGICGQGVQQCGDAGLECVTPMPDEFPETCNGRDDDCDGSTDEGFDTLTDAGNCGGCGNVCDGTCCDGVCVNTDIDEDNCGACEMGCGATQECCGGSCNPVDVCAGCAEDCGAGESCCATECVDTQTDRFNCGGCGIACGAGSVCCAGTCTPEDDAHCGGSCGDCTATGNGLCCNGACVPRDADHCTSCVTGCGSECCADQEVCTDTDSDPDNCGGCGISCGPTQACCAGSCTNVQADRDNCGVCGRECYDGAFGTGLGREHCVAGECD